MDRNFEWLRLGLPDRTATAIPVLKRAGGVLIVLLGDVPPEEEMLAGAVGGDILDISPYLVTNVLVENTVNDALV